MKNLARTLNIESEPRKPSQRKWVWNSRILVVEDEREIARSYADILSPQSHGNVVPLRSSRSLKSAESSAPKAQQHEFEVVLAHDVETALALVKKSVREGKPFAMGFFDVLLGGEKDGFELVKMIREVEIGRAHV